jgi:hypothetical protein
MIHNPVQYIEIDGLRRELLITPSLYTICQERGWEIKGQSAGDIFPAYCKLLYAAAVNAYEVRKFDNPDLKFDLTLLDIEVWAALNREDLNKMIIVACELLSGQSIKDMVEAEKKKTKVSIWSAITSRLKHFSLVKG